MTTFFDKLFTSKNKFFKSDFHLAFTCSRSSDGNTKAEGPLGPENVRVVVFRECERRGRKLLFDSDAVEKLAPDCSGRLPSHPDIVETSATHAFKYKKPNKDVSSLGEMIFGSVAICSRGTSYKIHMPSPAKLLLTTVMPTGVRCHPSKRSFSNSPGPGSDCFVTRNSDAKFSSSSAGLRRTVASSCLKTLAPTNCCDDRLMGDDASLGSYSSFSRRPSDDRDPSCNSLLSRFSSSASQPGSNSSFLSGNSCSGESLCSLRRRWNQSLAVSLDQAFSEDAEEAPVKSRTKLGLGVVLNLNGPSQEELQKLILNNTPALEAIIDRLQADITEAYAGVQTFVQTCHAAASSAATALMLLTKPPPSTPNRCLRPCRLPQSPPFVPVFAKLLSEIDSKTTNFFVSSLLTALLTHNLSWVLSVASRCQNVHQHTWKENGCNPLWFQHNQLLGATAAPCRGAKIVVTDSRDSLTLTSLVDVLAHFLRCSPVIEHQYEANFEHVTRLNADPKIACTKWECDDNFDSGVDCEFQDVLTGRVYESLVSSAPNLLTNHFHETDFSLSNEKFNSKLQISENCSNYDRLSIESGKSASGLLVDFASKEFRTSESIVLSQISENDVLNVSSCKSASSSDFFVDDKSFDSLRTNRSENCHKNVKPSTSSDCVVGVKDFFSTLSTSNEKKDCCNYLNIHDEHCRNKEKLVNLPMTEANKCLEKKFVDSFRTSENCRNHAKVVHSKSTSSDCLVGDKYFTNTSNVKKDCCNSFRSIYDEKLVNENLPMSETKECLDKKFVDTFRTSVSNSDCCNSLVGVCNRQSTINDSVTSSKSCLIRSEGSLYPSVASLALMENVRLQDLSSERDRTVFVDQVLRMAETTSLQQKDCGRDDATDEGYETYNSRDGFNSATAADVVFQLGDVLIESKQTVVTKSTAIPVEIESSPTKSANSIPLATGLSILHRRSRTMEDLAASCPVVPEAQDKVESVQEKRLLSLFQELPMPCARSAVKSNVVPLCPVLGVTEMLQPHLILQGVKAKAQDVEVGMRRDLARLSGKTALLPVPSQMVYILADLNKWEVCVVSSQHTALGSPRPLPASPSKLVADMLESFMHLHRLGYSHKFCEDHLERKLQEIYRLSLCVAQMLLENDLCTVDLLTKSLHISANDVPLLLSVATTHTPQIAEKYGVTFS